MLQRLLVGAFAYFAEDGDTINESTPPVISGGYDAVPSLGCIEQVQLSTETQSAEFLCPRASGGYQQTTEQIVSADYIDMTVNHYNEIVHRLQWGLDEEIQEGTPKSPFKQRDRKVLGWLCVHAVDQNGETLLELLQRVELRLNETPPFENAYGKPVLRFQALEATDNAIQFGEEAS